MNTESLGSCRMRGRDEKNNRTIRIPEKDKRAEKRRSLFFSGVFFLTLSNLITKLCGLFLKVPLTNTLGDTGMAYFNLAYAVYKWFYMISTAGLPVAAAVLTAEYAALDDPIRREAGLLRVRRLSLLLFCGVGALGSGLMFGGSAVFASLQGVPDAAHSVAAIAPALFCICIASALRGWYQGLGELLPASCAQVAEAVGKMGCGLAFGAYAVQKGYPLYTVAAYAISGLSVGCLLGMLVMVLFLPVVGRRHLTGNIGKPAFGMGGVTGRLMRIALPVTVSASVMSLCDMLDSMIVIRRLCGAGMAEAEALRLYGNYTALAVPMFNLPPILIYPVTTALIPVITAACSERTAERRDRILRCSLSATALVAMPCTAGMSVMAEPLLRLLYRDDLAATGAPLLRILALAVFFLSMLAMTNAVLQATDHAKYPMVSMAAGAAVKLTSEWILTGIPTVGILATPISTVLCYVTMAVCNLIFTVRLTGVKLSPAAVLWKPGAASLFCAVSADAAYRLLMSRINGDLAAILSVLCGAAVYFCALVLLRGVDGEMLAMFGFGKKADP
ncbi:MAG: polysaccharide biosynthesis protein [Clostridia bacterium]|nr:polysaccharide biosynthesis protein [Clostridia bacterium]